MNQVERITGLKDFGVYLNKLFTIDAFFLNEDRHTHNIAVLMNEKSENYRIDVDNIVNNDMKEYFKYGYDDRCCESG